MKGLTMILMILAGLAMLLSASAEEEVTGRAGDRACPHAFLSAPGWGI